MLFVNQNANVMKVILEVLTDDVFIHGTATQTYNVRMVNTLTNALVSAMSFIAVQIPDVPFHGKIFAINQEETYTTYMNIIIFNYIIKCGVSSRSSSLCFPNQNSDQMTNRKTHPTID